MISSKYEEVYPPTVQDFIYITKNAISKPQLLLMEQQILFKLQFELTETSQYRFLERFSKIAKAE